MVKFVPLITMAAGLFSLSNLTATSARAADLKFADWTSVGDVEKSITSATLTTAKANNADGDIGNINLTGADPVDRDSLNSSFGLFSAPLGSTATEGSGIYTDLIIGAGDVLRFDWLGFNVDPTDRLFAAINGNTFDLNGSVFSYTFPTPGTFRVGVGVVDQGNALQSSVLVISNADLTKAQAVPSPALLPAMIGFGLSLIRKRRSIG
jgi:hypothetical protein